MNELQILQNEFGIYYIADKNGIVKRTSFVNLLILRLLYIFRHKTAITIMSYLFYIYITFLFQFYYIMATMSICSPSVSL